MATAKPTEQDRAALSKARGELAAQKVKRGDYAAGSDEERKFISGQGDAEAKEGEPNAARMKQLSEQGTMSFKDGGTVPRTGLALVHKGEVVIPAGRSSEYRKVYLNRKNKTRTAEPQTRQGGGNTPVKGESHDSGSKKVPYKQAQGD